MHFDPEAHDYYAGAGYARAYMSSWELYGTLDYIRQWLRFTVAAEHWNQDREAWLTWTPTAYLRTNPYLPDFSLYAIERAHHQPAGPVASAFSLVEMTNFSQVETFSPEENPTGTPIVTHLTGLEIDATGGAEFAWSFPEDEYYPDGHTEDQVIVSAPSLSFVAP
jgi:hypothetical protein